VSDNVIGEVRSGTGNYYEVKMNDWGEVYVRRRGFGYAWDGPGKKASSVTEAMRIGEAFVYSK
jgi:hypothetical protein